jgi:hypothetical protein
MLRWNLPNLLILTEILRASAKKYQLYFQLLADVFSHKMQLIKISQIFARDNIQPINQTDEGCKDALSG